MDAAGHPTTKNMTGEPSHWNHYTVVVNAAPGQAIELTLEAVWLAPSQQLLITADGDGSSAVTLVGHELPGKFIYTKLVQLYRTKLSIIILDH
jgi:hypothetical protein